MTITEQIRGALTGLAAERGLYRIARETGVQRSTLRGFLRGQQGVHSRTLDRLADYVGLVLVVPDERNPCRHELRSRRRSK